MNIHTSLITFAVLLFPWTGFSNGHLTISTGPRVKNIAWTAAGNLNEARYYHTATLLPSGKVLVTGGRYLSAAHMSSCEIFDPDAAGGSGAWSYADSMGVPRDHHAATLLRSAHVLITGGWNEVALSSCELYNSFLGDWTAMSAMNHARYEHSARLLPGNRVLVAGSKHLDRGFRGCEIFEYQELRGSDSAWSKAASGRWRIVDSLSVGRGKHTATTLPDGRVLVTGGVSRGRAVASCEIFDPSSETWFMTASMHEPREGHTATLLPSGAVLVAGGDSPERPSCELFDPAGDGGRGAWHSVGDMNLGRRLHKELLLPDGSVLVTGAWEIGHGAASCELFDGLDPLNAAWSMISPMLSARDNHTITQLMDGRILVVGGEDRGSQGAIEKCELGSLVYSPVSDEKPPRPVEMQLHPPYPNPVGTATVIRFEMAQSRVLDLAVYSMTGRRVRTLNPGQSEDGPQAVVWDGRDDFLRRLPPGLYIIRLKSGSSMRLEPVILSSPR